MLGPMEDELPKQIIKELNLVFGIGQTFYYLEKKLIPYLIKSEISTDDLELFYDTYGTFYYGSERYAFMITNVDDRPYWRYSLIGNFCQSFFCNELNDRIISYNNSFWDEFYPPNHPGCKAIIRAMTKDMVTKKEFQRLEITTITHPFPGHSTPGKRIGKNSFVILLLRY